LKLGRIAVKGVFVFVRNTWVGTRRKQVVEVKFLRYVILEFTGAGLEICECRYNGTSAAYMIYEFSLTDPACLIIGILVVGAASEVEIIENMDVSKTGYMLYNYDQPPKLQVKDSQQ
jgi:hypothetical protein